MKKRWSCLFLALFVSSLASGQEGALPRGDKGKTPGRGLVVKEKVSPSSCQNIFASQENGDALFSKVDGDTYFVLARTPRKVKDSAAKDSYYLLSIDLKSLTDKPLAKLDLLASTALIPHGNPESGFSFLGFQNETACMRGHAKADGFILGKEGIRSSFSDRDYFVVPTSRGRTVADMKEKAVKELDLETMQKRNLAKFKAHDVPLFYDYEKRQLTVWNGEEPGAVVRYDGITGKVEGMMKLVKGFRLLQEGGWFGVVSHEAASSTWIIQEVQKWSGDAHKKYVIPLPKEVSFEDMQVRMHFVSKHAVLWGRDKAVQHRSRKAWIFDYGNKMFSDVVVPGKKTQYISGVDISNNGNQVVMLVKEISDDSLAGILVFDFMTHKTLPVTIDLRE